MNLEKDLNDKKLNDKKLNNNQKKQFENYTFEQASKKLDEVISKLEEGNLGLEDSLDLYEQGALLIGVCNKKLEKATGVITVIKDNIESSFKSNSNNEKME
ncbi:MAG: exodeoxyribonuclease VII small subunit [Clostridia bacterium]|nr:exodeoxyribonuclease VII small subunit [Clostridia bacterium]MDD4685706.1 exodeoxyribonuclease VII small subunit [Clostridia bacterium]